MKRLAQRSASTLAMRRLPPMPGAQTITALYAIAEVQLDGVTLRPAKSLSKLPGTPAP